MGMNFGGGSLADPETGERPDVIATDGHSGLVTITPGHVSTDNSTDSELSGSGEFTGTWEEITNYGVIVISVTADVASATDGLMVQFSTDGTFANLISDDVFTIAAGAKKTFSFQAAAKFYRVIYTNGGAGQNYFNLQTILKPYYVKPSSHRIQDAIVDDDDAELVKSVLTGEDENNVFQNARVNSSGILLTANFLAEVALGNVPGYSAVNKYGHNAVIETGTDPEDVWSSGGLYAFYPATAQSMEVLSSSAEDGAGGVTGALTIHVFGLDANWLQVDEVVTLNGTGIVDLTEHTYIRMYRAIVLTAGSVGTNVGNIVVRIASAGATGAYIAASAGQTKQAIYTIPAGKTGLFIKGYVGIAKGAGATAVSADFKWKARPNTVANGAWAEKGDMEVISSGSSWWQYEYGIPNGPIPEKTDIRIECFEVSATLGVVAGFDMLLVDD